MAGASGAAFAFSTMAGAAPASAATARKRAYVLVVDGCRPGEIDEMANLKALRDAGTWYPAARSLPVMETIPNHVMMMTGCRPARNGVPANMIFDRTAGELRDCDRPTDIKVTTIIEQLNRVGPDDGHGAVEGVPLLGLRRAGHAPLGALPGDPRLRPRTGPEHDGRGDRDGRGVRPDLVFVNLGDVDRVGHADLSGTTLKAARTAALALTNEQVGRFVDMLKSSGRWSSAMVLVLADHSMDWSVPDHTISLTSVFDGDSSLAGNFEIAQNGGADLVYWTGPPSSRSAALAKMRSLALGTDGVFQAHVIDQTPSLRLGANAGDLLVYCKAGWRFSDPGPRATRSRATTDTRRPSPYRSSSAVARPWCARGSRAPRRPTRSTLPRRSGGTSGSRRPRTGWEGYSRL